MRMQGCVASGCHDASTRCSNAACAKASTADDESGPCADQKWQRGAGAPRTNGEPGRLDTVSRERRSRPISRVLSRATIPLGCTSPCTSSDLPGSPCGPHVAASRAARSPIWSCSRWGLPCRRVLPPARCALTAPFHPCRHEPHGSRLGGLFSVALSVGSRPPGVTWHLALGARTFLHAMRSGCLADSSRHGGGASTSAQPQRSLARGASLQAIS
jgi:hypothetical protein